MPSGLGVSVEGAFRFGCKARGTILERFQLANNAERELSSTGYFPRRSSKVITRLLVGGRWTRERRKCDEWGLAEEVIA